jgi:hypothetical protein
MAKKKAAAGVNKSEAIRVALKEHRGKKPKEIAAILNEQGVRVTAQYVSVIKGTLKGKKKTVKVRKLQKDAGLSSFSAAVAFIRAAGSLDAAKSALASIEEIKKLS